MVRFDRSTFWTHVRPWEARVRLAKGDHPPQFFLDTKEVAAHRITFQDGIVPARRGFRTVPGFVRVVSRLTRRGQRRKVVAGTLTAADALGTDVYKPMLPVLGDCRRPLLALASSVERLERLISDGTAKQRAE